MEATCSSETSVDFQLTTRRYIQENGTHQEDNHKISAITADFSPEQKHVIPECVRQDANFIIILTPQLLA
jgi:hypothetical protein